MKIYTEINYEWLDNKLVETSSKSFEYEGDLTLCGVGGGGGGGGTLGKITSAVTDTAASTVTDPVGTITPGMENAGAALGDVAGGAGIQDAITTGMETASENLSAGANQGLANLEEGISSGTSALALNEGVATTMGDLNQNISTNLKPITTSLATGGQMLTDNIAGFGEFVGEKANELTTFIHGSQPPSDDPLKKGAISGSKKGKGKSELAVNKGKQRARKSLRIG